MLTVLPAAGEKSLLHLKVSPTFSGIATVNVPFRIDVFLMNNEDKLKCGLECPLQLQLHYDEVPTRACPEGLGVIMTPLSNLHISKEGICSVMIKLTQLSMAHENKKFRLQISALLDGQPRRGSHSKVSSREPEFIQVLSPPIFVARHRLVLRKGIDIPDVWFKDQAGKDKAIEIAVDLIDQKNKLVYNRQVKLKVTCLYEDERPVPTVKDILTVAGDTHIFETGAANLRVRINDVSKNHQRQRFRLLIGPDTGDSPLNADIAPYTTTPITVKSKNKRERELERIGIKVKAENGDFILKQTEAYKSDTGTPEYFQGGIQQSLLSSSSGFQNVYSSENKLLAAAAIPSLGRHINQNFIVPEPSSVKEDMPPQSLFSSCYNATQQVIHWVKNVVDGLESMQWKQMGFEMYPDGSQNTSKPLYCVNNPNDKINQILLEYQSSTRQSLAILATEHFNGRKRMNEIDLHENSRQKKANGTGHVENIENNRPEYALSESSQARMKVSGSTGSSNGVATSHGLQDATEADVQHVLAVMTDFGFPVFNAHKELIGYYNEELESTSMRFISIGECEVPPTRLEMTQATLILQERIDRQDKKLYSISNGYNSDLVKMKTEMFAAHWQRSKSSI